MEKVSVIGLGKIGYHLATRLIATGYETRVYDIREEAVLAIQGAIGCSSPALAAEGTSYCILSLPTEEAVEQVVLGEHGIQHAGTLPDIVIDTSTISVTLAIRLYEVLKRQGVGFIDAPVTGGEGGAQHGTLEIMAGGDEAVFEKAADVLQVLGHALHIGEAGHGQAVKLANQMIMAAQFAIYAEAYSFLEQQGIDCAKASEVLTKGAARASTLDGFASKYLAGKHLEGIEEHYTRIFKKDMELVLAEGKRSTFPQPISSIVYELMKHNAAIGPIGDFPVNLTTLWRIKEML